MAESIVIVSAARTPIGGLLGDFASLAAWELGAVAVKAAVERAGVPGDAVDEVLLGNCLMAGQGQAPARQAMRRAGLPDSAGAVTLSKMCGHQRAAVVMRSSLDKNARCVEADHTMSAVLSISKRKNPPISPVL